MIERPTGNSTGGKEGYQPIPSNLDTFMSNVASTERVEEAPLDPPPADDPIDGGFDNPNGGDGGSGINWPPEDEDTDNPGRKRVSRFTGDMMARFADRLFANAAAMYTHGNIEDYEASQKEMEEISECFKNWASETGVEMSPTATLLMSLTGIYAFRIPKLYRDRQRNLQLEARKTAAEETARKARSGGVEDVTSTAAHADPAK